QHGPGVAVPGVRRSGRETTESGRRESDPLGERCALHLARCALRRREHALALLRLALRRSAAGGCAVDRRPLLARPQGWWYQRGVISTFSLSLLGRGFG